MLNKRNGFRGGWLNQQRQKETFIQRPTLSRVHGNDANSFTAPSALRIRTNPHLTESFDLVHATFPLKVYACVDKTGKFAITTDGTKSDNVKITAFDPKNENQWVMVEPETGLIMFFSSWKSYVSVDLIDGEEMDVMRSDTLMNGEFVFGDEGEIKLKENLKYGLAFKKAKLDYKNTKSAIDMDGSYLYSDSKVKNRESFLSRLMSSIVEAFDEKTDTPLECVKLSDVKDGDEYSFQWKFVELYDLRDLTDSARENELLIQANSQGDTSLKSYKDALETQKTRFEDQNKYLQGVIDGYEKRWLVKNFWM